MAARDVVEMNAWASSGKDAMPAHANEDKANARMVSLGFFSNTMIHRRPDWVAAMRRYNVTALISQTDGSEKRESVRHHFRTLLRRGFFFLSVRRPLANSVLVAELATNGPEARAQPSST